MMMRFQASPINHQDQNPLQKNLKKRPEKRGMIENISLLQKTKTIIDQCQRRKQSEIRVSLKLSLNPKWMDTLRNHLSQARAGSTADRRTKVDQKTMTGAGVNQLRRSVNEEV
jgi:hypothetical protein